MLEWEVPAIVLGCLTILNINRANGLAMVVSQSPGTTANLLEDTELTELLRMRLLSLAFIVVYVIVIGIWGRNDVYTIENKD